MNDKKQCETCPWPLECSADMKAAKPAGADCPREALVWDRRLVGSHLSLADTTPLDTLADETEKRELILV